jgi:hypothetical protein
MMIRTFMYLLRKKWKDISNTHICQCFAWIKQLYVELAQKELKSEHSNSVKEPKVSHYA